MRKVTKANPNPPAGSSTATSITAAVSGNQTSRAPAETSKADGYFQDAGIAKQLHELRGDAATMERVLPSLDEKALVVGTARSKPQPGANGFQDYAWGEVLGEELRKAGLAVGTGAGPGAMEAPLRGHSRMDTLLDLNRATRNAVESKDPQRQGAQIILPHEQANNPFIPESNLAKFDRFLFRMEFLFRNTSDFVATPGGYGTVAEVFGFMAMKSHGQHNDSIVFGAPDDFFTRFNKAFEPFLNEREKGDLANIFDDPKELVKAITEMPNDTRPENLQAHIGNMTAQLEQGLRTLDGKPPVVAFFGGMGHRTKSVAGAVGDIATAMAKSGNTLRVGGSPVLDDIVERAARAVNPEAEVQAFAMADAPVQSRPGLDYQKVDDVLVLRELMNTNLKGIVVSPEGAKQLALLFTAACDVQTGEMPKIPIVVLDPDGRFGELKQTLGELMLSSTRQYINVEDLDILTVTDNAASAIAALQGASTPQAPAHAAKSPASPVLPVS
jgi:predicted Rossmann-fold nucleotide-binding protein